MKEFMGVKLKKKKKKKKIQGMKGFAKAERLRFCQLGAPTYSHLKPIRFVLYAFSRRYRIWERILVLYTAWISPFEFGFIDRPRMLISIIDNIVNAFFALDIIWRFFIAYVACR